ncbi:hypothetical protein SDC9_194857 [bioreactor metagenome]|uniref:Uncharacterized protein n=1 Tax=bioreactor metagenome TaxID=1076179 RepID=A0A645I8M3_9ZZZZ
MADFLKHRITFQVLVRTAADQVDCHRSEFGVGEVHSLRDGGCTVVDKQDIAECPDLLNAMRDPLKTFQCLEDGLVFES